MTRTYALKRLLEHGPMTPSEMKVCTRWPGRQVEHALEALKAQGMVSIRRRPSTERFGYAYEAVV